MGRNRVLLTDTRTFSIITTEEMRLQLQAISVMMGRAGALSPIVREILERFIEKYIEENRREFDLTYASLMEQDTDQETIGATEPSE